MDPESQPLRTEMGVPVQWQGPELILTLFGILGRVFNIERPIEDEFQFHFSLAYLPSFMVFNPFGRPAIGYSCIGGAFHPS